MGTTDTSGYFSFTGLDSGTYTLTTNYRGYVQDIRSVNITGDTGIAYEIQMSWDNIYDKWIVKENDIIKY